MKQGCAMCMIASDVNFEPNRDYFQLFSQYTSHIFFRSLGSKKFNASNGSQFGVKTREIWPIETMLHKEHVVMGVQFFFVIQAEF